MWCALSLEVHKTEIPKHSLLKSLYHLTQALRTIQQKIGEVVSLPMSEPHDLIWVKRILTKSLG